jgi:hypothetical protein
VSCHTHQLCCCSCCCFFHHLQGNSPSDHFKRLETHGSSAANRNLLQQRSLLSSALLQAAAALPSFSQHDAISVDSANSKMNNRRMLQEQA